MFYLFKLFATNSCQHAKSFNKIYLKPTMHVLHRQCCVDNKCHWCILKNNSRFLTGMPMIKQGDLQIVYHVKLEFVNVTCYTVVLLVHAITLFSVLDLTPHTRGNISRWPSQRFRGVRTRGFALFLGDLVMCLLHLIC